MSETVPFTEEDVKGYLDSVIRHWRGKRAQGDMRAHMATYYIDAIQSVRSSLFGELLPAEGDEAPIGKFGEQLDVISCARCGEDHSIHFIAFAGRNLFCNEREYTHWGLCLNSGDPVLMRIVHDEEE